MVKENGDITMLKIEKIVKKMKCVNAPGVDEVATEMIKAAWPVAV